MHRVHSETLSKVEKRRLWDEIIQDFLGSDSSLKSYSDSHGLRYDHLSYYVGTYKKAQLKKNNFIPLQLLQSSTAGEIRIQLGAVTVYIPTTVTSDTLQVILQGLKSLC